LSNLKTLVNENRTVLFDALKKIKHDKPVLRSNQRLTAKSQVDEKNYDQESALEETIVGSKVNGVDENDGLECIKNRDGKDDSTSLSKKEKLGSNYLTMDNLIQDGRKAPKPKKGLSSFLRPKNKD
jgi:hypothetical protein